MNSEQQKWLFLRDAPERDALSEQVRELASNLSKVASSSPWPRWAFVQMAMALVRDCILYERTTTRIGREQIPGFTDPQGSTLVSLERGRDACAGKARLFIALCLAARIPARMVPVWKAGFLRHVFAEVSVMTPTDPVPRWRPVETILDRARVGDVANAIPLEIDSHQWAQTKVDWPG